MKPLIVCSREWVRYGGARCIGAGIDFAIQMYTNGWRWECVDYFDVLLSGGVGFFAPSGLDALFNIYGSGKKIKNAAKSINKGEWVYTHTTKSGRKYTRSHKATIKKQITARGIELGTIGLWQAWKMDSKPKGRLVAKDVLESNFVKENFEYDFSGLFADECNRDCP
ncbi:hypothetical protein [Pleionea sp. CnH1-48]|uniref:hypothetical protein n=1 Tax=Pleionea sp. CnH1-48 TaxID=2954494 RepID=UPI0020980B10|nr:hypothetical protein [Pleionea sp. CnH1-48]MCO7227607.1 hypothetical protein [Pleionea sp. CnH1-48]